MSSPIHSSAVVNPRVGFIEVEEGQTFCLVEASSTQARKGPASEAPSRFDKVASGSNPYEYYYRGLTNLFQIPCGEALEPSPYATLLEKTLGISKSEQSGTQWTIPTATYSRDGISQSIYAYCNKDVITNVAHDIADSGEDVWKCRAGNFALKTVIAQLIQDYPNDTLEAYVPVVQHNSYLNDKVLSKIQGYSDCLERLCRRAHYVLLKVKIENAQVREATLYDPKGWISSFYSGATCIKSQLQSLQNQDKAVKVTCVYTGHQGLLNFKDCGRFVMAYIQLLREGKDITTLPTAEVVKRFPTSEERKG